MFQPPKEIQQRTEVARKAGNAIGQGLDCSKQESWQASQKGQVAGRRECLRGHRCYNAAVTTWMPPDNTFVHECGETDVTHFGDMLPQIHAITEEPELKANRDHHSAHPPTKSLRTRLGRSGATARACWCCRWLCWWWRWWWWCCWWWWWWVVVLSIAAAVVAASYLAIKSTNQLWAILGHSPACRNLASIPSLVWHRAYVSVFSEPLSAAEVAAGKVLLVSGDSPTFGRAMAA